MLFINRFPPSTLTLYFLFAFPAISLLSLSLVQTYDTSQIFSESFFQYTKNFCTVQVLPSRIHTILLYTFLFSKSVAWGESPGWRSRRFAVSTNRTSVSVFNLSRDLKRYKMTFCTKLSQIQSAVQTPYKEETIEHACRHIQSSPLFPTPSAHDTGSGMQRSPAVSALPSPLRCSGSHTDRQVPLFLSSLPACQQLPASSACR